MLRASLRDWDPKAWSPRDGSEGRVAICPPPAEVSWSSAQRRHPLPMFPDQGTGQGSPRRGDADPRRAGTSPPPAPPPPVRVLGCLALRPGGGGAVGAGGPGQSTGARGAERAQGLRAGEGRGGLGGLAGGPAPCRARRRRRARGQ